MKALGKGSIASIVKVGLTIAWWALWAALILLALGAVGYGAILALIANGAIDPTLLTGGEGQARIGDGGGTFDLTYDHLGGATWPIVVPALVIGAVAISGGLIIVDRLRRLFESFTSGEPFRRENASHLRVIWITMLAVELARYLLLALIAGMIAAIGLPPDAHANFDLHVDISTWMSIAILIVLAEVFREGARMKEEQELTI